MVEVGERDDLLKIPIEFAVGFDDVGAGSPITPMVERSQKKELGFVSRRVEDPTMDLSGSHVDDSTWDKFDDFEVNLVAPRAGLAPHEQVEVEPLQGTELWATSTSDQA